MSPKTPILDYLTFLAVVGAGTPVQLVYRGNPFGGPDMYHGECLGQRFGHETRRFENLLAAFDLFACPTARNIRCSRCGGYIQNSPR